MDNECIIFLGVAKLQVVYTKELKELLLYHFFLADTPWNLVEKLHYYFAPRGDARFLVLANGHFFFQKIFKQVKEDTVISSKKLWHDIFARKTFDNKFQFTGKFSKKIIADHLNSCHQIIAF